MNVMNALLFAAFGATMEILPMAFPSWFQHTGADSSSGRALWLELVGAVQILLCLGYIARAHVIPAIARLGVIAPTGEAGPVALPNPRGVTAR